jgi:stage II sporulation protein D
MRSGTKFRTRVLAALTALAALFLANAGAEARVTWHIDGGGYGHGVGMSQYGARGLAAHGSSWEQILAHYFPGTSIGVVKPISVRVLLASGLPSAAFSGANLACGVRLQEAKTYQARPGGSGVLLLSPDGQQKLADCGQVLTASSGGVWDLVGKGTYRGALQLDRSGSGGLDAVDWVSVDDYVRGVVAAEVPSRWPIEALKAQAVAARSYALSSLGGSGSFDLYDDTRSQAYGGVAAETQRTDLAVLETALEVVADGSKVARTYFFSTSGGHTENVQNVFGGPPVNYLRGVTDPYDAPAPYHSWHMTLSQAAMDSALAGLVKGQLDQIRITKVGASPRVLKADLVGSNGTTSVDGATLQARLGLRDRWVTFRKLDPDAARRYRRPWVPS